MSQRLPHLGTREHDEMAERVLAMFGDGVDATITNMEYHRDRATGLYDFEEHVLFARARQLRDERKDAPATK